MPIQVGFAREDITPPLPFPLAGLVTLRPRPARWIRDPLYARAAAFADGERTVVLLSADLLTFPESVTLEVMKRLAGAGVLVDGLMLSATHTHSSFGGYWATPTARKFMGPWDEGLFEHLVDSVVRTIAAACADLKPARLSMGTAETRGLNWNRRHPNGAVYRDLGVLVVDRGETRHRIVSFAAHPVVAAERAVDAASADFPGALLQALDCDGTSLYVSGPVGSMSPLWPEQITDVDDHLALLRDALLVRVAEAEAQAKPVQGDQVRGAANARELEVGVPKLFPERWWAADMLALPLRLYMKRFVAQGVGAHPTAPVSVLRIGDVVLAGFPADLDPGVALAVRDHTKSQGLRLLVAASHTNAFVGYIHSPEAYELPPIKGEDYRYMTIYENAMAAAGRDVGAGFVEQFREALTPLG